MKIIRGIIKYTLIIIGLVSSSFFGKTIFYMIKNDSKTDGAEITILLLLISLFITIKGFSMSIKKEDEEESKEEE